MFSSLSDAQVGGMLDAVGRGMGAGRAYEGVLERLRGMGLAPGQAREALDWACDFYLGARNPGLMMGILEGLDAGEGERAPMIRAFRRLEAARNGPRAAFARPAALPDTNSDNRDAFDRFVSPRAGDPDLRGKYAAFVHGKCQKAGANQSDLVDEMYEKFGNVKMYVGRADPERPAAVIDTPELA